MKSFAWLFLFSFSLMAQDEFLRGFSEVISQIGSDEEILRETLSTQSEIDDICDLGLKSTYPEQNDLKRLRDNLNRNQIKFELHQVNKDIKGGFNYLYSSIPKINLRDEVTLLTVKYNKPREYFLNLEKTHLLSLIEEGYMDLPESLRKEMLRNAYLVFEISKLKNREEINQKIKFELGKESERAKIEFIISLLSYIPKMSLDNIDNRELGTEEVAEQIFSSINKNQKLSLSGVTGVVDLAVRLSKELGLLNTVGIEYNSKEKTGKQVLQFKRSDEEILKIIFELPKFHGKEKIEKYNLASIDGTHLTFRFGDSVSRAFLPKMSNKAIEIPKINLLNDPVSKQNDLISPKGSSTLFLTENPSSSSIKTNGGKVNLKMNLADFFYTELALAGFSSVRSTSENVSFDESVSGKVATGFNIIILDDETLNVSSFGDANFSTSRNCTGVDSQVCTSLTDERINSSVGIKANLGSNNFKLKTTLVSGFNLSLEDYRNSDGLSLINPVHRISTDSDFKVVSNLRGVFGFGVSMQAKPDDGETDWRYSSKVGLGSSVSGTFFEIRADGLLSRDTPLWIPVSENQGSIILKQSLFHDNFFFGINGRSSLEDPTKERYIGIFLGGTTF